MSGESPSGTRAAETPSPFLAAYVMPGSSRFISGPLGDNSARKAALEEGIAKLKKFIESNKVLLEQEVSNLPESFAREALLMRGKGQDQKTSKALLDDILKTAERLYSLSREIPIHSHIIAGDLSEQIARFKGNTVVVSPILHEALLAIEAAISTDGPRIAAASDTRATGPTK